MPKKTKKEIITLTVYFNPTPSGIKKNAYLVKENLNEPRGRIIPYLFKNTLSNDTHLTHAFDGSWVTHGWFASAFGIGLDDQCRQIAKRVADLVSENKKVIVNACGASRGGVAAMLLAIKLSSYSDVDVETNLVLLDPVPGNSLLAATFDDFGISLAERAKDLTDCRNLKRVLAGYFFQEKRDERYFHAPLVPVYPKNCQVDELILPGRHNDIFDHRSGSERNSHLLLTTTIDFLQSCGSLFKQESIQAYQDPLQKYEIIQKQFLRYHNKKYYGHSPYHPAHMTSHADFTTIEQDQYKHAKTPQGVVCEHHAKITPINNSNTDIRKPYFTFQSNHFRTIFTVRWKRWLLYAAIIAIILTSVYFTMGLAGLPYLGILATKLGALSIPLITASISLAWVVGARILGKIWNSIISRGLYFIFYKSDPGHVSTTQQEEQKYQEKQVVEEKLQSTSTQRITEVLPVLELKAASKVAAASSTKRRPSHNEESAIPTVSLPSFKQRSYSH